MALLQINGKHVPDSSSGVSGVNPAACPDCAGARLGVFEELITRKPCAFETTSMEARSPVPSRWSERYGFALVRRGVFVRQRINCAGRATALDAAGPGCVFAFEEQSGPAPESAPCDYAATDCIVCLLPRNVLDTSLETSSPVWRELLAMQQATLYRVERITQARGAGTVRDGVAMLLCALADTLSPPRRRDRLPVGLRQRDLARLLGVRHETFCRVLGDLEREGAVRREADGLVIVERALLERAEPR
jgi:CRP/FNR family transcriptional regulator, polysaccharide utilization system transcription regulator